MRGKPRPRKSEEARRATHKAKFGAGSKLPPRGTGLKRKQAQIIPVFMGTGNKDERKKNGQSFSYFNSNYDIYQLNIFRWTHIQNSLFEWLYGINK